MNLDQIRGLDGTKLRYALMELAKSVPDAIALGRGDPDLPTPKHIVEAAERALENDDFPLAPIEGMPSLRAAVAQRAVNDHGLDVGPDQVLITTGGQEALFLIMQALLDPGDQILVPDPRYSSYDQAIAHTGAEAVSVPTYAADEFDLRPAEVEARLTPLTKALLLVTPSNPTGGVISPGNARRLAAIAQQRNFMIVSDEIYSKFVWPPYEHVSLGAYEGMRNHVITLGGFSKSFAMTGWRVGYVIAPEAVITAMAAIKRVTTGPVAALSQIAALAAATGGDESIDEHRAIYTERRAVLGAGLREMGLRHSEPRGGFFFWSDASSTGLRAIELSYLLLERAHVLIFPGTAFGNAWSDYLRITILQPVERLKEAVTRMTPIMQDIASMRRRLGGV